MNENESINIHVNLVSNNCFSDEKCILCGELFSPHAAIAKLEYWWQGPRSFGYICDDCLAAGPIGAAKRTRDHAEDLRKWIEGQIQLADSLEITPEINWKTTAELREADKKLMDDMIKSAQKLEEETGVPF